MRKNNLMRRSVILLLLIVVSTAVQAHPVSRSEALLKARQFMPSRQFAEGRSWRRAKGEDSDHPFYVFNDEKGRGFVIVSGDDRTLPILGYADSGALNADSLPVNLRCWLEGYAEQIASLDEGAAATSALTAAEEKPAIAPLITTTWNQSLPYSLMTPTYIDESGNESHYVTGCVATALAQVMNYHQWPLNCPAIPGYTTGTKKIVMPELPPTTFKWNLMKDHYQHQETGASADAVAELMLYVGQANSMNYKQGGSSAYVHLDVMAELFSYSKNAWRASREDYSVEEWENLIYNELASNRPVLYEGGSGSSAHQFVCDGYDGEGFFHINWGWGGGSDGYFVLSLANPDEKGIGGGSGTAGYAFGQVAVIGFQPASDNEPELPVVSSYTEDMPEATYWRNSTNADFEGVSTEGCHLGISYTLPPTTTCDIEAGWAVCIDGKMENVAAYKQIHIDNRTDRWSYYDGPNPISFGAGLSDGNYKLVPVYRYVGDSDWTIISTVKCIYAQITGNTLSVRGFKPGATYTVNSVDYSGEMAENSKVDVTINITNTSDVMQERVYFWMRGSSDWQKMGQGIGCVEPGQTGNIYLSFTADGPGTFPVKITSDEEGTCVMGTSEVTIYGVKEITDNGLVFLCNIGTKEAKLINGDYSSYEWNSLEIPSTVSLDGTNYRVTRIDNYAFGNVNSLKKVIMPEGLLFIGESAFQECYGLREIHLPSTLKAIGNHAFAKCNDLNWVVSYMSEPCAVNRNAFTLWKWLDDNTLVEGFSSATLYVPIGTKPNYESSAGWNEFKKIYQGELKEITIEGITYFYATGEAVASIERSDAEMLRDKDVVIPSSIEIDGKSYEVKSIANNAFEDCLMKSLTIEPGIEEIGRNAFFNAYQLEKAVLPEGLLSIGEQAFQYCSELKEIYLPSTLEEIAVNAFGNCYNLKAVVSYMSEPCAVSRNVFTVWRWYDDDTSVEEFTSATLYVPIGTKPNYESAAVWNEFSTICQGELKEITIEGITYSYATGENIASVVRSDAEILRDQDVVIPSSIEIDGKPYEVKSIGNSAFVGCPMKSLIIEPGIEEIGRAAFWNAYSIRKVILPEGLLSIGESAFRYCYGLQELQLPSTLAEIGDNAFYDCRSLNSVVSFMSEPCPVNRNVFVCKWYSGDDESWHEEFTSATLSVPLGKKEKYQAAEVWKEFSTISEFDPTSIPQVVANEKTPRIFDLSGRRLNRPRKGLFIINGKKVLIN